jgi:hypothetical protein
VRGQQALQLQARQVQRRQVRVLRLWFWLQSWCQPSPNRQPGR